MNAIRLWCLLALVSVVRCELGEGSGNGMGNDNRNARTDDEDSDDFMVSGSGDGNSETSTSGAPTTAVVTQTTTTTPRTTTKAVVTTKLQRTTQLVQQQTTTTEPNAIEAETDEEEEDDDNLDTDLDDQTTTNDDKEGNIDSAQTTVALIVDADEIVTQRTSTVGLDIFQYVWSQPGIVAGLIGGAVLGVLFAILLTLFVIYRLRRRNDRTYRKGGSRGSQDETGAFWFDEEDGAAIAYSRASAERYPQHGHPQQANAYVNPQAATLKAGTSTLRGSQMLTLPPGMGPQAQPLLYTAPPMAPNAQNTYDEYLANLYNQQLYGGYLQQKA